MKFIFWLLEILLLYGGDVTNIDELLKPARMALTGCMNVQKNEKVLIVTNPEKMPIAEALFTEARNLHAESSILVYPPGTMNGEEPPDNVREAMFNADVILAPTVTSISHTDARRSVSKKGRARIATLPGITEEIFIRGLSADYKEIAEICDRVYRYLNPAKRAHVTTPYGMDLTLDISNEAEVSNGLIHKPGDFSNLPDGETELAPVSADGILVANRCDHYITAPTKFELKDGYIVSYDTNDSGKRFRALIEESMEKDGNTNASFIAEFAIGTNPTARVTGNVLEDEKVLGTCHIAFGDNTSYPGGANKSTLHMDVIIFEPTITLDDKMIMENGTLLI
ncbi:aminopeptidase [candidate division KSB1 bacterium]